MDPVEIHLIKGPHGKPMLSEGSVQFNLSHSGSCALVGVSSVPVGIDVEDMSKPRKTEDLRRRFFSDRENAEIDALPVALQEEAFFHCWTRKEAYLKAIGLGIGIPLKSFSVSVAPDGPVELLASEESPEAPRQWWFQRIPLDAPYVGCITLSRESTFKNFKTCFFQYLEG